MKPRRWWPGLIPLALIWLVAVWVETKQVEEYLALQAGEAAKAVPLHKVHVAAAGRDLTVSGEAFSEGKRDNAPVAVGTIWGVRRAQVETQLIPEAKPFSWSATRAHDEVILAGSVPSPEARTKIVDTARARIAGRAIRIIYLSNAAHAKLGETKIVDQMSYARGAPEEFEAMAELGLAELGRLDNGILTISDTNVSISGGAEDEPARNSVVAALGKLPPGFRLAANEITVPIHTPVLPANVEPPGPVDMPACQQMLNDEQVNETIQFKQNSTTIDKDSYPLLDKLTAIAARCPSSDIEIGGHTDSIGTNKFNVDLSRQRAQAVVEYLAGAGLGRSRLTASGFGSSKPIASNNTKAGRARNRRIEFVLRETP